MKVWPLVLAAILAQVWWTSTYPARDPDAIYIPTRPSGARVLCHVPGGGDPFRSTQPRQTVDVGRTPGPLHLGPGQFPCVLTFELWGYAPFVRDFNEHGFEGPLGDRMPPIALTPRVPVLVPLMYALRDWPFLAVALLLTVVCVLDGVRRRRTGRESDLRRLRLELGEVGPGQVIGGYELGTLLGRGAMAHVYEARRADGGEVVAFKILSARLSSDRTRLEREVRAWRGLSHPNIVHLLDWGEDAGRLYVVMTRVYGETLADRIARGPLAPADLTKLCRQLLDALTFAHGRGVVHRDVKPSNVMVTPQGRLLLLDFGIAATQDASETPAGTPGYAAPEAIRGGEVVGSADLYAAGVTVYHAALGRHPFAADSIPEMLARQATEPLPPLRDVRPDVPEELSELLERLTSADPARRG